MERNISGKGRMEKCLTIFFGLPNSDWKFCDQFELNSHFGQTMPRRKNTLTAKQVRTHHNTYSKIPENSTIIVFMEFWFSEKNDLNTADANQFASRRLCLSAKAYVWKECHSLHQRDRNLQRQMLPRCALFTSRFDLISIIHKHSFLSRNNDYLLFLARMKLNWYSVTWHQCIMYVEQWVKILSKY